MAIKRTKEKKIMLCPFSRKRCRGCPSYIGRHYYILNPKRGKIREIEKQ